MKLRLEECGEYQIPTMAQSPMLTIILSVAVAEPTLLVTHLRNRFLYLSGSVYPKTLISGSHHKKKIFLMRRSYILEFYINIFWFHFDSLRLIPY
jgi:hypothetical protein